MNTLHYTSTIVKLCLVTTLFASAFFVQAQDTTKAKPPVTAPKEDKPLKFNLNEDGSHFFQATFLNQTWLRYNESNPGTTVLGQPKTETADLGLRRTRIQMYGQVTDRVFLYFQFGMNNFNFLSGNGGNRKNQSFFHDAVCEYKVTKGNQLKLGGGLTITNGLSRFSQPSIGSILALDVPVFLQATVDQTDEFSRKLSVYARGQLWKFDYRFSISDPFPVSSNGTVSTKPTITPYASFATLQHYKQFQSYIMFQFFEHEGHLTPYMTGTHLGKKKIFNIASGAIYQKNAMWKLSDGKKDTIYQSMLLTSLESFLDLPLNKEKGTALTAHAGYYRYFMGSNYIRTQAQMNPADGLVAGTPANVSGSGNGIPLMGTGHIFYSQVGYLFAKDLLGQHGTLQPYACYQRNNFDRLKDPVNIYNVGVNWLIKGHKAKISLDYQNRPVYNANNEVYGRRGCYILQYQIFI